MASDNKVLATHESLERAVSQMASVIGLPVPERELKLVHPEDLPESKRFITDTFMESEEGYICLPKIIDENIILHEAAHWVLLNNGYNYSKECNIMYGLLYDEVLANLAQITFTGSTYKSIFTKDAITEEKKTMGISIEAFTSARNVYVEFLSRDDPGITKKELESSIVNCDEGIAKSELKIKGGEFLYWHFGIEEKSSDAISGKLRWKDFYDELIEFHKSFQEQEILLKRFVVGSLAHRAAVSHYIHKHKPKDIFDGLLKNGRMLGQDVSFIYFMLSAEWARQIFEEKKVEEWMQQPIYLMP